MYCMNRVKVEGIENVETYCMLELGHEGPCQKAKIVRDRPSFLEQSQEVFRPAESKNWTPK